PALAQSSLPDNGHHAAVPRSRFLPRAQQLLELDVPSDELRQSPPRLDVETALLPSPADQLVNQHGRVATLDREQATRFPLERLKLCLNRQRGCQSASRMVLVGDGSTEESHDPISGELIDRAFMAMHGTRQQSKTAVHDAVDGFGVELLAQRAEADNIGEKHG